MTAIDHLRAPDVTVTRVPSLTTPRGADDLITITVGNTSTRFAVRKRQRAPFRNEIAGLENLRRNLERSGRPLLVAPYVPASLGDELVKAGWSWADDQGNYDIFDRTIRLRQRLADAPSRPRPRHMPAGSTSLAIIRALIDSDNEDVVNTSELSKRANVSQPRASQVLSDLAALELVDHPARGEWRAHRTALLDQFLNEYRGPGGTEKYFYSLDEPVTAVAKMAEHVPTNSFVVSADIAADFIAPWRHPTIAIVYITPHFPTVDFDLVGAGGRTDANVIIREPRDHSVFAASPRTVHIHDVEISLADTSQIIWDLVDLGGADRLEAAGLVREWLLTNH